MRVALCDDESYVLSVLEDYFQRYADKNGGDFSLIKFTSGIPLLKYVEENNDLDIIFLDIQMPELNGIEVAHIIRKKDADVKIFFLTSIIKYALEGYKVVSAKYSYGFPNPQDSSIIVAVRYLDYFTTMMEDRLWQVIAKPVFLWQNRSGLLMNAARAA